jgi:hypothetical protein
MKSIIFLIFVAVSLMLYCFFICMDPANEETFKVDPTGKYYNPL